MSDSSYFFISLLPESKTLDDLDGLRYYFNTQGFSLNQTTEKSHTHMTMATGKLKNKNIDTKLTELKTAISESIDLNSIKANVEEVSNVPTLNENNTVLHNWIALTFESEELASLANSIDQVLKTLKLSTTKDYVDNIKSLNPDSHNKNIVGDHINMCTRCVPEKAYEATQKCAPYLGQELMFDTLVLRYKKDGELVTAWELKFATI